MHMTKLLVAASVAIVASGCTGTSGDTDNTLTGPSAVPSTLQNGTAEIAVTRLRVFLKDGQPQAYVEAPLGDGCTNLDPVIQQRSQHTITVTMTATRQGSPCTMIFKSVSDWVPLAGTFDAGLYTLHVNRVTAEFRLAADPSGGLRIEPDPGPLPTIPPPTPGVVSPDDPPGGSDAPGQIPGMPGRQP
jgi:hypothetical protein